MTRNRSIALLITLAITLLVVVSLFGSGALARFVSGRATATPTPTRTSAPTRVIPPTATATPDPCAPVSLPDQITAVHKLMREFDDASLLAQSTPLQSLSPVVADLQRLRREAEDQAVPVCLVDLKGFQLAHMNTVISTFMEFMVDPKAPQINALVQEAREYHAQYDAEISRLMGWTPVPTLTPSTPGAGTVAPSTSG